MSEHANSFHIQVVTTKDRVTRILISERVIEEIPFVELIIQRLVASDWVEWPESFVITHHAEPPQPKSNHPIVVLPPWIFERMDTEWSRPRKLLERVFGFRVIDKAAYSFAWVFAYHFKSDQDLDPEQTAISGQLVVLMDGDGVSYRHLARGCLAIIVFLPVYFVLLVRVYGLAKLSPPSRDTLFRLAMFQLTFSLRKGLRRTQQKLIAAGASPEDVRKYDLPPDLQIIDNNEQEPE